MIFFLIQPYNIILSFLLYLSQFVIYKIYIIKIILFFNYLIICPRAMKILSFIAKKENKENKLSSFNIIEFSLS